MKKLIVVLGVFTLATAALAVKETVDRYGGEFPLLLDRGLYISKRNPDLSADVKNRITAAPGCIIDYDFPAPKGTGSWEEYTPSRTCLGVKAGDPCFIGVMPAAPLDGGSGYAIMHTFTPIAVADNVVVIRDVMTGAGDGGTINPPDAGYNVRCLSNRPQ